MQLDVTVQSEQMRHRLTVSTFLVVLIVAGCNDRAVVVTPEEGGILPPPNPPSVAVKVKQPEVILAGNKSWLNGQLLPYTTWYVQYLNTKCIGFSQFTVAASETQGSKLLRLTKRDVFEVAATSTGPVQRREILLESLEHEDGEFQRYTETSNIEGSISESEVVLQDKKSLTITKKVGDKTTPPSLPWIAGTWGPLGTIEILHQQPMEPGEHRKARVFVPSLDKIVNVDLKSIKKEHTTLPGSLVQELLMVETVFVNEKENALTKNWVNDKGEIIKSVSQGGFSMFQCTPDEAERVDGSIRAAQRIDMKIPVQATIEQLRPARVTYLIDSTKKDPFGLLSRKVNQQVTSLSALSATLTIDRVIPTSPISAGASKDPPDESLLLKFDADTAQLQTFISESPEPSDDALSTASKMTGAVFRKVEKAPLSRHFSTPSQVVQQRKGDCKAHSILLVAALRERGIPARAASGLRILKEKEGEQLFAIYHMWVEAWVGERWMPLDPFAGSIGVGADHIKFSESSLNEKNLFPAMLNVLENMEHLTVSVREK